MFHSNIIHSQLLILFFTNLGFRYAAVVTVNDTDPATVAKMASADGTGTHGYSVITLETLVPCSSYACSIVILADRAVAVKLQCVILSKYLVFIPFLRIVPVLSNHVDTPFSLPRHSALIHI